MASFSKAHRKSDKLSILRPHAFRRDTFECSRVGPEARQLWENWFESRSKETFDAVALFYLPLVSIEAHVMKRRNPDLYRDDIDEMISDGCMGLMRAIHRRSRFARGMMKFIRLDIRDAIRRNLRHRMWGGETRSLNESAIRAMRRTLIQRLGRMPTRDEMIESLADVIRNPNIYVDERSAHCMSQISDPADRRQIVGKIDPGAELPIDHVMDRETKALCLKGLKGRDRSMFEMLLNGSAPSEIAKAFSLSKETIRKRCNGLIWQARCNAELAEYFDVEPGVMPEMQNGRLPSIADAPPARRIA